MRQVKERQEDETKLNEMRWVDMRRDKIVNSEKKGQDEMKRDKMRREEKK